MSKPVIDGTVDEDTEKFLTEIQSQFNSDEIIHEVKKRLDVIHEISAKPEISDAANALRDRLTQIFSGGGQEKEVLTKLKDLTEVRTPDGKMVDLRSFFKRERRTLTELEYRESLARKVANTRAHVINLTAYYHTEAKPLSALSQDLNEIEEQIKNISIPVAEVKIIEDQIRDSKHFHTYEDLKIRFLKEWLAKFAAIDPVELEKMDPADVQRQIQEHQRHQMTELLKSKIKLVEEDMTDYLGIHDTLEGGFREEGFWRGCNRAGKSGFSQWILAVIQGFGMLRGQRYALFQSEQNKSQYLLFGLGIPSLQALREETIVLVPYIKPFTKKGNYLLEIRNREIGDPDEYYHELRHYAMPFLFAFDQMRNFDVNKELISFFTSTY